MVGVCTVCGLDPVGVAGLAGLRRQESRGEQGQPVESLTVEGEPVAVREDADLRGEAGRRVGEDESAQRLGGVLDESDAEPLRSWSPYRELGLILC
ncbi:hypothetical protein SMA5143A_5701 [Streptomyces sp. MA5143a]|nr:hypothetical protein SMA5143A_5701 [Streptomyces sp. MA5143a]